MSTWYKIIAQPDVLCRLRDWNVAFVSDEVSTSRQTLCQSRWRQRFDFLRCRIAAGSAVFTLTPPHWKSARNIRTCTKWKSLIQPPIICQSACCAARPSILSYWWLNWSCGAPVKHRSGAASHLAPWILIFMSKHQLGRLSNSQRGDTLHAVVTLNLKAKGFLIPSFVPHVSMFLKPKTSTLLQLTRCSRIPRIHCWWIKDARYVLVYPSLLLSWFSELGGWWEGMFHVPVFRCLLFLSIWSRSLGQRTGDSIRCFEVVRSVLSLHFLFSLPVSPPAFVALIRKVPGHV